MSSNKCIRKNKRFFLKLLIVLIVILIPFMIFKDSIYIITSPSMTPTLNIGDVVIKCEKDPEDIKVGEKKGDILIIKGPQYFYDHGFDPIFWNYLENNTPIIHRAIDKKQINGIWYFLTKGDNNLVPDGGYRIINISENYILIEYNRSKVIYISETEILGVVIFKIPLIGYLNIFFPIILTLILIIFSCYAIFKKLGYEIRIIKIK
ncbi:MAG: signal peptidase I [Promethearchaeota archaeon]